MSVSLQFDGISTRRHRRGRSLKWLEGALWVLGIAALGYCAVQLGRAAYDQHRGSAALDRILTIEPVSAPFTPHEGDLVGRIEIPRIESHAIIFEGTTDDTLSRGAGHFAGSANPGDPGNVVLAGHRDTFFRELKEIRRGDEISLTTARGRFQYVVESMNIVNPDAVDVLRPSRDATLTLITCYPFHFIGSAPQRYIVRGKRIS